MPRVFLSVISWRQLLGASRARGAEPGLEPAPALLKGSEALRLRARLWSGALAAKGGRRVNQKAERMGARVNKNAAWQMEPKTKTSVLFNFEPQPRGFPGSGSLELTPLLLGLAASKAGMRERERRSRSWRICRTAAQETSRKLQESGVIQLYYDRIE